MKIEQALNIFKRLQFEEYEWFIKENKYLATRYSTITMEKMQEKLIDFIEEQQKELKELKEENLYLKTFLYTIRDMTQEVLIIKGDKPGTYRPIKNTRRHEVYEIMVKIRHFLYGEYIGIDHKRAIQKKLNECIGEEEINENS